MEDAMVRQKLQSAARSRSVASGERFDDSRRQFEDVSRNELVHVIGGRPCRDDNDTGCYDLVNLECRKLPGPTFTL
jgi:hypothetical protein